MGRWCSGQVVWWEGGVVVIQCAGGVVGRWCSGQLVWWAGGVVVL